MSHYLEMWTLIKESSVLERKAFLRQHSPAKGHNVEFRGQTFFDVDLLEAIRNSIRMVSDEAM